MDDREMVAEITPGRRFGYWIRYHEKPDDRPNGWLTLEEEHRPWVLTRRGAERKARRGIRRRNRRQPPWEVRDVP